MKLINKNLRITLIRLTKKRKKNRKRATIRFGLKIANKHKIYSKILRNRTITVHAPVVFFLRDEKKRGDLVNFIEKIKNSLHNGMRVKINFDNTRFLNPCGTIWFLSELSCLLNIPSYKGRLFCNYPKNRTVEELFQHVGFFEWMGLGNRRLQITSENVVRWSFITGENLDGLSAAPDSFGLAKLLKRELGNELTSKLFDGVKEAIINVIQHAYPKANPARIENSQRYTNNKWSLFFSSYGENGITISICDLGVGIPNSLDSGETPWGREKFLDVLSTLGIGNQNSNKIVAALTLGRTSTNENNRGKGLHEMKNVAMNSENGFLHILSHHGYYLYEKEKSNDSHIETHCDFGSNPNCTIIQWGFNKGLLS